MRETDDQSSAQEPEIVEPVKPIDCVDGFYSLRALGTVDASPGGNGVNVDAVSKLKRSIQPRLDRLYGDKSDDAAANILKIAENYAPQLNPVDGPLWSEQDAVLITYADQVRRDGEPCLQTLTRFLERQTLDRAFSAVHLLPFYPYSSDDGFSVIDYKAVDAPNGDWGDVRALSDRFKIMGDLVLNHISAESDWFKRYLLGQPPYVDYFIEVDPGEDLSKVVRPRSLPLLTPFETARGKQHLWTTFSSDQIDLNYKNPDVLAEVVDALLFYLTHGMRILRLDAVAFLWKEIGTSCLHLPQTHETVKLFRNILDALAPGRIILTETNVPHEENLSYLGAGDEAHMVYQFSLAPLLLEGFLTGQAEPLTSWAKTVCDCPPSTTYLNFTASHDGVGVRPIQNLVAGRRFDDLLEEVVRRSGRVSMRKLPDGGEAPYELNIAYYSALEEADAETPAIRSRRFLASQAIMLALKGVPAVYFHSLTGTPNDLAGMTATGRARSINRRKYQEDELERILSEPDGVQAYVFRKLTQMLQIRRSQPAFHPDGRQIVLDANDRSVFAFVRTSVDGSQSIVVVSNLSDSPRTVELGPAKATINDLLAGEVISVEGNRLMVPPYRTLWLEKS